jgi:hypothetical protein
LPLYHRLDELQEDNLKPQVTTTSPLPTGVVLYPLVTGGG